MFTITSVKLLGQWRRHVYESFLKTGAVIVSITIGAALAVLTPSAIAAGITIAWDASVSPEAADYKVHWGPSSGTYSNSVDVGNTTGHTLSGLGGGQTYYIAVTAHDINGARQSSFSKEVSATTSVAAN